VLYWVVTGQQPVDATARAYSDPMVPAIKAADRSRYSEALLRAIDWTLVPAKDNRPKSVAEFRQALTGGSSGPATPVPPSVATAYAPTQRIAPASPPASSVAAADPQTVTRLVAELATHIGPIADKLVRSNLRKGVSLVQIVHKVSSEITDPNERKSFVHRFVAQASQAPGQPSQPVTSAAPVASAPAASTLRFQPEQLAKAEADLAQYIGAVARVVVKRAAAKARDLPELYLLLADEIEDPQEKKKFVRRAISAARPH
jgi:serine/threonine-protein kinase